MDLGEDRQRIEAFSITVDAEVGMPIPPCRQQTPNSGTGIVDSAEPRLRIRPLLGDLHNVGVEADAEGEGGVLGGIPVGGHLEHGGRDR